MQLTCPACGARYEVAADLIPAAGRAVRCSGCQAEWMASGAVAGAAPAPAPAPPPIRASSAPAPARDAPTSARAPEPVRASPGEAPERVSTAALIGSLEADDGAPRGHRRSFAAGLAVVALMAAGALGIYVGHDAVVAAVPGAAEPIAAYVAWIDDTRAALDQAVAELSSP
jgi:predicted Zn finger-like uncharacterized protein